jgi:glycerophosphoryl diester phosphodiesterase
MKVLAHRGLVGRHAENTLGAFEDALRAGADGLETDVRLTADGRLVLFHDRILADGRLLAEVPLAAARRTAPAGALPTVEEALHAFPDALWNLEVKAAAALPPLLARLAATPTKERPVLSSFDHASLRAHAAGRGHRLGALIAHRPSEAPPEAGVEALVGFDVVVFAFEALGDVHALARRGVASWVYDPQTEAEHASLAGRGLEAVITDHPGRAAILRGG